MREEKTLGANRRAVREAGGLSREVTATKLGVTTSTCRKMEYGFVSPRVESVQRFRELFDASMADVIPDFHGRDAGRGNHSH